MSSLMDVELAAVRLLSMREHTAKQLKTKLLQRAFDCDSVEKILADLQQKKLLSDERFAVEYIVQRRAKGFGPVRIAREMKEKGVSTSLIDDYLDERDPHWFDEMEKALDKKFGRQTVLNFSDRARRARFLEYRGFAPAMIQKKLFAE